MNAQSLPLINFLLGWPSPSLLPHKLLRLASQEALSSHAHEALAYSPEDGYGPLRDSIAAWLTDFYRPSAGSVTADRISVTGGASQSLACILQTFSDPVYTRNIWMVAPTYFLACQILEDSGFAGRLRGVPEDDDGVDLDFLEKALIESEAEAVRQGNLEPVGKLFKCVVPSSLWLVPDVPEALFDHALLPLQYVLRDNTLIPFPEVQGSTSMAKDLQAHHLRCANFRQPLFQEHVPRP